MLFHVEFQARKRGQRFCTYIGLLKFLHYKITSRGPVWNQ